MLLIYEETRRGTRILFFANYKKDYLNMYHHVPIIFARLVEHPLLRRFRKIEIVFMVNKWFSQSFASGIQMTSFIKDAAYFEGKDVKRGKNRFYVNLDKIYALKYGMKEHNYGNLFALPEENKRKIFEEIERETVRELIITLIHEISHLWYDRVNDSKKYIKRSIKRLRKAYKNMIREGILVKRSKDFGEFWVILRECLLDMLESISTEGFTTFVERLERGNIEYTRPSIEMTYKQACEASQELDNKFKFFYSRFIEILKLQNRLNRKQFERIAQRLIDSTLKAIEEYRYPIGLHVYHMIMYVYEDIALTDLAKFQYDKLIRLYEQSCEKFGWRPVISLFSKKGVFSYPNHVYELTRLRKESKHFVGWH